MSKLTSPVERQLEAHILGYLASLARGTTCSRGELERAIPDDLRRRCGAIRKAVDGNVVYRDRVDLRARLEWLRRKDQIEMIGTGRNARYRLAPSCACARPTP